MGQVSWAALKTSNWEQINGSDPKRYRTWIDSGIQIFNPDADSVAVTDSIDRYKYNVEDATDTQAITESVAFDLTKVRNEYIDLTDSIALQVERPFTDSVGITEAFDIVKYLGRTATDVTGIAEDTTFDVSWVRTDAVPVAESVVFEVSWNRSDSVAVTETVTVVLQMQEVHYEQIGITESVDIIVWDTSESGGMSLVDDVRTAVQTTFGLSDAAVAVLSINDLLHMYWSGDFPALHTYDGSESTFTPADSYSTMDHHSSVESQEGTDLNWIRSVTAT